MTDTALRTWFDSLPNDAKEYFEEFRSTEDLGFDNQTKDVLAWMSGNADFETSAAPGCERLSWVAEYDYDGNALEGWNVGISLGNFYLYQYVDWDEITDDRDAVGIDQAWALVEGIHFIVQAATAAATDFGKDN